MTEQPLKILYLEDDTSLSELAMIGLSAHPRMDVLHCGSGKEAIAASVSYQPQLCLFDVMLPEMDGYEVLRRLRADNRTTALPVLMLTAKGQREDRETAIACGADMFITKPFVNSELIAAVQELAAGEPA